MRKIKARKTPDLRCSEDQGATFRHSKSDFKQGDKIHRLPFVYIIQTANLEFIKVGRATNFKQRLSAIQCGCPYKLGLLTGIRTPKPIEVESFIHDHLGHAHVRGEWFSLNDVDFDWLLEFVAQTNLDVRSAHREASVICTSGGR